MPVKRDHDRKTKVLYVSPVAEIGGAEKSLLDILDCLDRERFDPVVALPGSGTLKAALDGRHVPTAEVKMERPKRTWNPLKLGRHSATWQLGTRQLGHVMDEHGAELVHANGDMAQLYAYPGAQKRKLPLVWHVRDLTSLRLLRRRMAFPADRIIAISEAVKEMLLGAGIREDKVQVVLNGIDTAPFEAVPRPQPGRTVVGMIAHLYPWKGHRDFLQVAAMVKDELPDTRFAILGDDIFNQQPDYREELLDLRREVGLEDCLDFLGLRDEVPSVLADWSLLAHPSHGEPFGRAVVEALAAGRPVVSWRTGGPAEIIEDGVTGALVEPYDLDGFAHAVIEILKSPQGLQEMGERGREVAQSRFHRERTVSEVQAIYEELLA